MDERAFLFDLAVSLVFSVKMGTIEDAEADLIIGADGAYSKVRKIMAKRPLFNCTQTYIEHGYVELSVPSGKNNEVSVASYKYHDNSNRIAFACFMDENLLI